MIHKILIADDEPDIVIMLKSFFESKGYFVLTATDGLEALSQASKNPDIILLDINMPYIDGLSVCERIRSHICCPILFLTARIEDSDKIKGFAVGGDDYIIKPFSLAELEARVSAHLRREERHSSRTHILFDGDLSIDFSNRCLFYKDSKIQLAKKEFDIVELLCQNPGQVFDKERIYERLWGYESDGDSTVVAEHIRRIRKKIACYTDKIYLETVWGCGYKWIKQNGF
ncbi:alkaline phosphatase synthesis transcriptional regulatory protein PhoP [Clostridiales bacterium]|nr:alkaline phosphatase synthesis transcriptional regulatory protein PhoP [Clostridiales bacterium]